jgi:putative membrane protein
MIMGYGYGPGWGMMGWGGYGGFGYGILHLVVSVVILVAVVAFVTWLVRSVAAPSHYAAPRRSPGLDALEERYARGEIGRDEYLQKRKDIEGR